MVARYNQSVLPNELFVAASNASDRMKFIADEVCEGVDDGPQIQSLIDRAAATSGYEGTVRLSEGLFVVGHPAGQTKVSGTATQAKSGDAGYVAGEIELNTLSFAEGDIDDVAVGQLYRISGGARTGSRTIEMDHQEIVATVSAKTATTFHLKGGGFKDDASDRYVGATFERIIGALDLKCCASIIGSGQYGTTIKLANNSDCAVITSIPVGQRVGIKLHNLVIHGNRLNQTSSTKTIGYALNTDCWDSHISDVTVIGCKSDARWYCQPWGHHLRGGWTEFNAGMGVCVGYGTSFEMHAHKTVQNSADGLYLRGSQQSLIYGNCIGAGSQKSGYAIYGWNSNYSVIEANEIRAMASDCSASPNPGSPKGCIGWNGSYSSITGNTFRHDANTRLIRLGLNDYGSGCLGNIVTRNIYSPSVNGYHISLGYPYAGNYIDEPMASLFSIYADDGADVGPYPARVIMQRAKNVGASTLTWGYLAKWTTVDRVSIDTPTSKTATDFAGMLGGTTSPAAGAFTTFLITEGFVQSFPYDDDSALSIGSELCVSEEAGEGGVSTAAGSGDWVVAIALQTTAGSGTILKQFTGIKVYILPQAERYLKA